jgi:hypothetical protein
MDDDVGPELSGMLTDSAQTDGLWPTQGHCSRGFQCQFHGSIYVFSRPLESDGVRIARSSCAVEQSPRRTIKEACHRFGVTPIDPEDPCLPAVVA